MKKVLFIIQDLQHGGAEKVLVNLANNLDKTKYDVTIRTLFDKGVNKKYIHGDVHYIPGLKWEFRGNSHIIRRIPAKWLYRWFVKEHYDIVVSYLEGSSARVISGCTDPTVKKVGWIHIELDTDKRFSVGFGSKEKAIKAYEKMDRLVFVSKTVQEAFEKTAGRKFENGIVKYNTNETDDIVKRSMLPVDDLEFSDTVNVCSVAKIVNTKGYDRLIRVHERLLKEGYCHHIYLIGIGEMQPELEKYAAEHGLTESFTFVGFRDNPYKYVANCDFYICSSRREGFSTAVTESLVIGTPVVSTNCSGAYELLGEHNEYGIVVENSEEGIYEGMKQMLSDPELLKHYKSVTKERGQMFSREKTVRAVEEMFESLLTE